MAGLRCRSSSKILGLSVSELARLKAEYHNYETARRNSKQLASNDSSFDKERYDKNRKRRLMKDKNSKCQQNILPPYQVYVCQNGHLHKERVGSQDYKHCSACFGPSVCKINFMQQFKQEA